MTGIASRCRQNASRIALQRVSTVRASNLRAQRIDNLSISRLEATGGPRKRSNRLACLTACALAARLSGEPRRGLRNVVLAELDLAKDLVGEEVVFDRRRSRGFSTTRASDSQNRVQAIDGQLAQPPSAVESYAKRDRKILA